METKCLSGYLFTMVLFIPKISVIVKFTALVTVGGSWQHAHSYGIPGRLSIMVFQGIVLRISVNISNSAIKITSLNSLLTPKILAFIDPYIYILFNGWQTVVAREATAVMPDCICNIKDRDDQQLCIESNVETTNFYDSTNTMGSFAYLEAGGSLTSDNYTPQFPQKSSENNIY